MRLPLSILTCASASRRIPGPRRRRLYSIEPLEDRTVPTTSALSPLDAIHLFPLVEDTGQAALTTATESVLSTDLVMHLQFDESSGAAAADSSPNGGDNAGVLRNGASFDATGGNSGGAVLLDGVDDYVAIADSSDINTATHAKRTVSVWFQVTDKSVSTRKQVIYEEGGASRGLSIYVHDGLLYVGGWNENESGWAGTFLSTAAITNGAWHHVALTLDAIPDATTVQADAFAAYLDGVRFGLGGASQLWSRARDVGIGAINDGTKFHDGSQSGGTASHALAGAIDDLRVYNRTLSDAEIAMLADPGTPVNEAPVITSPASVDVPENQTAVIDVQSTDTEGETEGAGLSYSLTGGVDQALFSIVAGTGVLTFNGAPDFESPTDADRDNVYEVQVTVTDSSAMTGVQNLLVTVTDVIEGVVSPTDLVMHLQFDESSGTAALDSSPNGGDNPGTLSNGAAFAPSQGSIGGAALLDGVDDYVSIADSGDINTASHPKRTVSVWFQVTDKSVSTRKQVIYEEGGASRGLSIYVHAGLLYVGGWNQNESGWTGTFLSTAAISDGAWHHVALTLDAIPDATIVQADTFAGYLDGVRFGLGGGSQLWSRSGNIGLGAINDGTKFHDGANSGGTASHALAGAIDDARVYNRTLSEAEIALLASPGAPTITSPASVDAPENQTAVIDAQSSDPEGETEGAGLSYSLTGGADQALFSIVAATGVLTFNGAPDFENPADADLDNVYEVQVTVTDSGAMTGVQDLLVTVTDVNEAPTITSPASVDVVENQTAVIDAQSTDAEGETEGAGLSYSLTGGVDQALFSIVAATGVLTFNSAPDFENPADGDTDNVYEVQVAVTDSGAMIGVQDLLVTVTDVNEGVVSPTDLVMYLQFDESSGTAAADSSPNGADNAGTLHNGASFASSGGTFGGAVLLDGVDDYVSIADSGDINTASHAKRTVSVWFQVNDKSVSTRKQVIYEEGGTSRGLSIYVHAGLLYVGGWNQSESGWTGTFLSTAAISDGVWHHVALTLDAIPDATTVQADTFAGYLDGARFGLGGGSQLWSRSGNIGLGAINDGTKFHDGDNSGGTASHAFAGAIDDARVYNRTLSEAEIALLAVPGAPVTPFLIVTIAAASISENGGSTTGMVSRTGETTDPLTVTLTSSDLSEATVTGTVTILAGQASASFAIDGVNDAIVDGTQTVTITASATGFVDATDSLIVIDDDGGLTYAEMELAGAQTNDTGATAESVTIGVGDILTTDSDGWLTIFGSLWSAGDQDFFSFTLAESSGVFFDLDAQDIGSFLDGIVTVFSGSSSLGANDNGYDFEGFAVPGGSGSSSPTNIGLRDSSLYLDLDPGTYSVRVSTSATQGNYELRILADANYATSVPILESFAGAPNTLFLDFDGHSANDAWGSYSAAAYDFDGNTSVFSPAERLAMKNVWRGVSEDFSPFEVNVTTVEPASFVDRQSFRMILTSSSASILGYGSSVLGVAYLNSYSSFGSSDQAAFVFAGNFSSYGDANSGRIMASPVEQGNTSSHEFGHALGLLHYGGTNSQPGALMNTPDRGLNREKWAAGQLHSGQNPPGSTQDDLATIASASNTIDFRADDHSDASGSATDLGSLSGATVVANGIITETTDADYFAFTVVTDGSIAISADVDDYVNNLDVELRIYASDGMTLLGASDSTSSFDAALSLNLTAGTYFAEVRSDGEYGELGRYSLSISPGGSLPDLALAPLVDSEVVESFGSTWLGSSTASIFDLVPTTEPTIASTPLDRDSFFAASVSRIAPDSSEGHEEIILELVFGDMVLPDAVFDGQDRNAPSSDASRLSFDAPSARRRIGRVASTSTANAIDALLSIEVG